MRKKTLLLILPIFAAIILSGCGKKGAEEQKMSGQQQIQAESADACSSKNENDSCEFTRSQGNEKVEGVCRKVPQGDQLVCMPKNRPSGAGGPGGPNNTNKEMPKPASN